MCTPLKNNHPVLNPASFRNMFGNPMPEAMQLVIPKPGEKFHRSKPDGNLFHNGTHDRKNHQLVNSNPMPN